MIQSPYSDIDYRILVLLTRARDSMLKVRGNELSSYGISPAEAGVLILVKDMGDQQTPAELSRRLYRDHTTVTSLLGRMEEKGLITREKDSEKNTWRIGLTKEGEAACELATKLDGVHSALVVLSEIEKQRFESYLKTVYESALSKTAWQPPFD